jgi:hypothetical protein
VKKIPKKKPQIFLCVVSFIFSDFFFFHKSCRNSPQKKQWLKYDNIFAPQKNPQICFGDLRNRKRIHDRIFLFLIINFLGHQWEKIMHKKRKEKKKDLAL